VKKVITILLIFISMILQLQAQQILGISYDISVPTLDTKEFINTISFKDDRLERVNTEGGNTITIDDRSMESYPLMVNSHYYFFTEVASFRPFFGGNIGTYFIITRRVVDGVRRSDTNWHFGLAPDIGFMLHFMQDVHVMLTLRYNYAFKTGGSPAQTYFSILFGFVSISIF